MARVLRPRAKKPEAPAPKRAAPKRVTKAAQPAKRGRKPNDGIATKTASKGAKKGARKGGAAAAAPQPRASGRAKTDKVPMRLLDRFNSYTIAQLKAELGGRNLRKTGIKQDLFMRLVDDEEQGDESDDDESMDDDEEDDVEGDDIQDAIPSSSLPDYSSDHVEPQQPKKVWPFIDCVAHFDDKVAPIPDGIELAKGNERPYPHHFFIPDDFLDTSLENLIAQGPAYITAILQSLVNMNGEYKERTARFVLQWHMPERYLIALMSKSHEEGLLGEAPFEKPCKSTWGNRLTDKWRTDNFMNVVDAAPALLREWSSAIEAEQLAYGQMPTDYAENPNRQWSFGRALIEYPWFNGMFKQLVVDGKIHLPNRRDTTDVDEEDLVKKNENA